MKHYIAGIILFLVFGCTTKPIHQHYQISKIELGRSGAWSDPGAALSVDSNLVYNYYGMLKNNKKRIYYTGKVPSAFWDTLTRRLEQTKFRTAIHANNLGVVDANEFELIVHTKNGKVQLLRMDSGKRDSVLQFMIWLASSYKNVILRVAINSVKFETKVQLPPPVPKIDHFPPPVQPPR